MVNGAVISTMGDLGETQIALELHRTTLCWLVGWLVFLLVKPLLLGFVSLHPTMDAFRKGL